MSISLRIDTSEWIAGSLIIGDTGLGIAAEVIEATTATGDDGPGLLYAASIDPANAGKELRLLITSGPTGGTLFVNEDGSFSFAAADGYYTFEREIYADAVLYAASGTVEFYVGQVAHSASGAMLSSGALVDGASSRIHAHNAVADLLSGQAVVVGATARTHVHMSIGAIAGDAAQVSATSSRAPGGDFIIHTASGSIISGAASLDADVMRNVFGAARTRMTQTYSIRPAQTSSRRPKNLN